MLCQGSDDTGLHSEADYKPRSMRLVLSRGGVDFLPNKKVTFNGSLSEIIPKSGISLHPENYSQCV